MAKFDLNKMNLGAGLLNETTRQLAQRDLDLVYIPYEKLRVDKRNQYSVDRISELAESISDVGLQQPLNVAAADDGMYDVLGGQRRYLAIGQLREAGNKKYDEVPCTVVNPQNIDLPVDDETKYLYVIATTNDYRDLTDGDKLLRIRQLSEVYDKISKAGGGDRIGKRRRDFISDSTQMSPRSAQDFLSVEKKLDDTLKDAIINGDLDIHTGVKIASMPASTQQNLASRYSDSITGGSEEKVDFVAEVERINNPAPPKKEQNITSSDAIVIGKEYIDNILSQSKDLKLYAKMFSNGISVSAKSKERLDKLAVEYEKLQAKFVAVLKKEASKK